jgi:hypothetical protein
VRWSARKGAFSPAESQLPHETLLHRALIELKADLPIAEFLRTHFADRQYTELCEAVRRMVEGYDAADPDRASTFALREQCEEIVRLRCTGVCTVPSDRLPSMDDGMNERGLKRRDPETRTKIQQTSCIKGRVRAR